MGEHSALRNVPAQGKPVWRGLVLVWWKITFHNVCTCWRHALIILPCNALHVSRALYTEILSAKPVGQA